MLLPLEVLAYAACWQCQDSATGSAMPGAWQCHRNAIAVRAVKWLCYSTATGLRLRLDWTGTGTELDWTVLDWTVWAGLDWTELDWDAMTSLDRTGLDLESSRNIWNLLGALAAIWDV